LHVFFSETLENILVADPHDLSLLKITDFGLSTQLDSQFPRSVTLQCGTLIYMAPEILFRYTYTKSVDIYSCSIIMYMLFQNGKHPLYTPKMSADEYKKRLLHSKFPPLS
jgi:serine/threonine protein kinase